MRAITSQILLVACCALTAQAEDGAHVVLAGDAKQASSCGCSTSRLGAYIAFMKANSQDVDNEPLYSGLPPIPPEMLAAIAEAWGLKRPDPAAYAPTNGKVNGTQVPDTVDFVPGLCLRAQNDASRSHF